ncbi:MAG: hypothetical protein HY919_07115 [Elusimicrobia bacterium]|nr:hypothetical protein [Elusimicrobiota bacterium]
MKKEKSAIKRLCDYAIKCFLFFSLTHLLTYSLTHCLYAQTNPEVYFNSGIDKYVKGDYDGAVALFEQTLSEKPDHQKARNFLVKVLIEATEKQIMMSNFSKAKIYIDKAKIVAPDNERVNELQKVISGGYEKSLKDFSKKEVQKQKTVVSPEPKASAIKKPEPKKSVAAVPVVVGEPALSSEYESKSGWIFILLSVVFIIIVFILIFLWIKKKNTESTKKMEEFKNQIRSEEEKKYKRELEKIKLEKEKIRKELAENIKIQIAEKKAITDADAERAHQQLASAIEEDKLLDTITDGIKSDEYSREIIQKMTISIRTIMNVNKNDALNNIKRLSKSENSRLRYDCIKIIENILTSETLKILLDMLDDSDSEVKRAIIMLINNISKLHLPEIPANILIDMQKRLAEEKLKNGWII